MLLNVNGSTQINFYVISDAPNVINKELGDSEIINIKLKRDFDIINPVIVIKNSYDFDIKVFNYAKIEQFGRYYFVNSVDLVGKDLYKIEMSCDVLETYKDEILLSDTQFNRAIKDGDYNNVDLDSEVKQEVVIYESDKSLIPDESTMIMSTVGNK